MARQKRGAAKREVEGGNLEEEGQGQKPGERGEEPMTRDWNPEENWQIKQPRRGGGGSQGMGQGSGRAERRRGGYLEQGGWSAAPRALAPVPSLHLPHFPSPLPPHTPQGSRFRFAVESLRGLIPSSITLHPCGGAPLVYFLNSGCPHHPLTPSPHHPD